MKRVKSKPKRHKKRPKIATSPPGSGCTLTGRIWLEKDGETFLGWGRVVLLDRIREHGSLTVAARSMGMGYRHAWTLVDQMNRLSPKPLVTKAIGGLGGGGSRLTPEGEAVVDNFWKIVDEFKKWLATQDSRLWLP